MKHNFDYCIFILPFLKWILYLEEWYHYLSPILKSNQSVHLLLLSPQALRYPLLFQQNHFPNGKSDVTILLKIPSRNPWVFWPYF